VTRTDWDGRDDLGRNENSQAIPDNAEVAGSIPACPTNNVLGGGVVAACAFSAAGHWRAVHALDRPARPGARPASFMDESLAKPPKRTMRARVESNAIAWPKRAAVPMSCRCVHNSGAMVRLYARCPNLSQQLGPRPSRGVPIVLTLREGASNEQRNWHSARHIGRSEIL
jgi:hypothetical protein